MKLASALLFEIQHTMLASTGNRVSCAKGVSCLLFAGLELREIFTGAGEHAGC